MKKNLLSALLIVATVNVFATVLTVSNQSPNPGQYTTIQAAINAATAGDSIYVHPSPNNYAPFNLDRQLTIIGNGFEPATVHPNPYSLIFGGNCNINNLNASGSKIIGLWFYNSNISFAAAGIHDFTITRCEFTIQRTFFAANMYNITIAENLFYESGLHGSSASGSAAYGFLITNNVFRHSYACCSAQYPFDGWNGIVNTIVTNNLFYSGGAFGNGGADNRIAQTSSGITFSNNIFNKVEFGSLSTSTFSNCITFGCVGNTPWINNGTDLGSVALGTQNIANTSPDFVNQTDINAGGYTNVNWFVVNPGSPTLSGMAGDPVMGPYGGSGAYDFRRASASSLPYVYSLTIGNPTIQAGSNLNIDVIGKKHD